MLQAALGPAASRTLAFTHLVSVGLRDIQEELRERIGGGGEEGSGVAPETEFFAPSPPRGSRWRASPAPRAASKRSGGSRDAPSGFVRLTTMIVDRSFVDAIDAVREVLDGVQPGLVASRAALIREALSRGLAAYEAARERRELAAHKFDERGGPFQPLAVLIPMDVLFPPRERPTAPVGAAGRQTQVRRPRPRARRTKRGGARAGASSGDSDDGEPPARRAPASQLARRPS